MKHILEYSNELIAEVEAPNNIGLFLESLIEDNSYEEFGIYLENLTLEEMQEHCEDIDSEVIEELKVMGRDIKVPEGIKKIMAVAGAGWLGSVAGQWYNPGHLVISGKTAAGIGGGLGIIGILAAYASAKCLRHLWNFIRCSYRAFTLHKNPAGTTISGASGSTVHTWDKR